MSASQKCIYHGRLKLENFQKLSVTQLFHAFTEWFFSVPGEIIHTVGICMIYFFFFLRAPWLHVGLLFTNNLGGTWVWSRIYISALLLLPFKQGRGQNQQLYKALGSLPMYTVSIRERPQSLFDLDLHPDLNFRPVTDHNLWALCVIRRLRCSSSQFFLT